MKNVTKYKQTKFYIENGKINPSNDKHNLQTSSWLIAKLVASCYEKALPQYAKGTLLDLGCGNVPLYDAYKPFIQENVCVDWGNSVHRNSYLDMETDINTPLQFPDETFETIILSDVLEHLVKPQEMFKEMKRILKTGGYILMNSPFNYWIHEAPYDYYRYTEHWYKRIVDELDLEIITLEPIGGIVDVKIDIQSKLIGMIFPNARLIRLRQKLFYYLFRKSTVIQKLNNSNHFTLGYFIIIRKKHG